MYGQIQMILIDMCEICLSVIFFGFPSLLVVVHVANIENMYMINYHEWINRIKTDKELFSRAFEIVRVYD